MSLSESVLKHIITIESAATGKWLLRHALSDALNTSYANYQLNDRARVSANGSNMRPSPGNYTKLKQGQTNESIHSMNRRQ